MPTSPLSRVFGTKVPYAIKGDIDRVNALEPAPLKKLVTELEKIIFSKAPIPPEEVTGLAGRSASTAGLSEDDGRIILRLYASLVPLVAASSSEQRFREALVGSGLKDSGATLLSQSLYPHKGDIEKDLAPTLGERFGPTVTRVFWRIDQPVAGSEPFVRDPVAVVTFVLDTATDTYDERFEVDLASLDLLLDELANVRRELAKIADKPR